MGILPEIEKSQFELMNFYFNKIVFAFAEIFQKHLDSIYIKHKNE